MESAALLAPRDAGERSEDRLVALSALFSSTAGLRRFRQITALLSSPRTLISGLRAALTLKRTAIALPDSAAGREIKQALRARRALIPNSLAAGLLALPDQPERYFTGRRRQALRTNMRRARELGMTCREPDTAEMAGLLNGVLAARGADEAYRQAIVGMLRTSPNRFWVVELDGTAVALAAVTVADDYAYLAGMLSVPSADSSAARYLLSGHVFERLAHAGVRSVLTGSTISMSPGLIYFQERLGFEPRRLVLN